MYFGITPLSEHSENDIETTPPKTAIAETQHIDSKYMPNAADTSIFWAKPSPNAAGVSRRSVNAPSQPPHFLRNRRFAYLQIYDSLQKAELRAQVLRIGR